MSRIGRLPIEIPKGVDVIREGNTLTVKGPLGALTQKLHPAMKIEINESQILVSRPSDEKEHRSLHGLTRSLIFNMVEGVTKGYVRNLEMTGVGYRATKQGTKLVLSLGFSHPVEVEPDPGIEIEVLAPTKIAIKGVDKQAVGQVAANIRELRPPEPYLGKGIRYAGERIRRKAGKTGKAGR